MSRQKEETRVEEIRLNPLMVRSAVTPEVVMGKYRIKNAYASMPKMQIENGVGKQFVRLDLTIVGELE